MKRIAGAGRKRVKAEQRDRRRRDPNLPVISAPPAYVASSFPGLPATVFASVEAYFGHQVPEHIRALLQTASIALMTLAGEMGDDYLFSEGLVRRKSVSAARRRPSVMRRHSAP